MRSGPELLPILPSDGFAGSYYGPKSASMVFRDSVLEIEGLWNSGGRKSPYPTSGLPITRG